jgi:hypothetical protein
MEDKIIHAYIELISCIVSSNSIFLIPSLQMLVRSLIPSVSARKSTSNTDVDGMKDSNNDSNDPTSKASNQKDALKLKLRKRQRVLHKTLSSIMALVPTGYYIEIFGNNIYISLGLFIANFSGLSELIPVLTANFPYKRHSQEVLSGYVNQLLFVCEYLPLLQPKILELIMQKCLEIDVEIVIEDSGEVFIRESDPVEMGDEDLFDSNHLKHENSFNSFMEESGRRRQQQEYKEEFSQKISEEVSDMADKLDSMLILLIEFVDRQVQ